MNILISAGIFPPDIGGPADFVARIAIWLSHRGHAVEVVCWSDTANCDDSAYPFRVHRVLRKGSRVARFFFTTRRLLTAGKGADVVFVNGLALEAQAAALFLRRPTLQKVVGDYAWEVSRVRGWYSGTIEEFQRGTKSVNCRLLCLLRTLPLMLAARVVTPSLYLARLVAGWGIDAGKSSVIYNSTPAAGDRDELPFPPHDGMTITTVCRLVPWKGVDRLIALMAELPGVRLIVAGSGPQREFLERLSRQRNVSKRVLFLGQLQKPRVRALLCSSDIFVLNSSYEGLPHVVLEAMAARVPVVATDVGGTGEAVVDQETGLLVPPGDDRALLDALKLLISSEETRRRLAETAATSLAARFTEETCFSSFEITLAELAQRGGV
ncbi:glycosyltransferase family 4 protein [Geomonas subterranea]|uniref:Glycosyltransferase family 4 protein n=1 Tax=Geomonas subterranea TaxID=2847989 RepID=A0ABX8LKW5_9BACT|nr:glycosyltransferase family 4 protein [Geomonas subterranea]QXE91561.1 glycosyltransferase family 4 protein [Geomonas subterranea]